MSCTGKVAIVGLNPGAAIVSANDIIVIVYKTHIRIQHNLFGNSFPTANISTIPLLFPACVGDWMPPFSNKRSVKIVIE
jgi:hypothetical protein